MGCLTARFLCIEEKILEFNMIIKIELYEYFSIYF